MYIYFNNNPSGRSVGDCAIRAISKALDIDWEDANRPYMNSMRRDGYSYDDSMTSRLYEMMEETPDERKRQEFKRFIQRMESM